MTKHEEKKYEFFYQQKVFIRLFLFVKLSGDHVLINFQFELFLGSVSYIVQLHSTFEFYYL